MTRTETRDGDEIAPARFKASERVVVVTDDGELVQPGDETIGMLGVGGAIPLGYYKDPEKTAATFRTVGGRRYSIPGDYATRRRRRHDPAARPRLGVHQHRRREGLPRRGRARARARIPTCSTASWSGVPDDRWGEMVVALVQPQRRAHDRRRRADRALPRVARRVQGAEADDRRSTRSNVRRPARPTTSGCARSPRKRCAHEHVPRQHGSRGERGRRRERIGSPQSCSTCATPTSGRPGTRRTRSGYRSAISRARGSSCR